MTLILSSTIMSHFLFLCLVTYIEIFKNERVLSLQKFKFFFGQNMQRYILDMCVSRRFLSLPTVSCNRWKHTTKGGMVGLVCAPDQSCHVALDHRPLTCTSEQPRVRFPGQTLILYFSRPWPYFTSKIQSAINCLLKSLVCSRKSELWLVSDPVF